MSCAICGRNDGMATIRQYWLDAGGFGPIPPEAIAHVSCDLKEQRQEQDPECIECERSK